MNRREAITALLAVPAVGHALIGAEGHHYGPLTLERHRQFQRQGIHLHVYHKGVDVTADCRFADDTPGQEVADVFLRNANGKHYTTHKYGDMASDILRGDIVIRPGAPFA